MCNTYCSPTARMVALTRLITFTHALLVEVYLHCTLKLELLQHIVIQLERTYDAVTADTGQYKVTDNNVVQLDVMLHYVVLSVEHRSRHCRTSLAQHYRYPMCLYYVVINY